MRLTNWFVGIIGVASLITALFMHFSKRERIRMTSGTSYFHEAADGYGILAGVKRSIYDPSFDVPMYEVILFDGSVDNANSYFSPLVITADEESAEVYIDSPKGRETVLSVYHTKKPNEHSYLRISTSSDDREVTYADTDGDFLPDRRITRTRGEGQKVEAISYAFEEMDVEQGVAPQSATRSESDSEGVDKPQPESNERSR
jgi:hypothetical protein